MSTTGPTTEPTTEPTGAKPGRSADATRALLVDAATRVFAEQGVHTGSLLEVTRIAGQRNRGAVHYHFGSRDGILIAVLEPHVGLLARREHEVLQLALARPDDDLGAAIEAIVRPVVELSEVDWRGAAFLRIVCELIEQDPETVAPEIMDVINRTGGVPVYELIVARLPPMPDEIRDERLALMTSFVLNAVADRATVSERPLQRRTALASEPFITNLVSMAAGMLAAPV